MAMAAPRILLQLLVEVTFYVVECLATAWIDTHIGILRMRLPMVV